MIQKRNPFVSNVAMPLLLSGNEPLVVSHIEQKQTGKRCRLEMDLEVFECTPHIPLLKLSAGQCQTTN